MLLARSEATFYPTEGQSPLPPAMFHGEVMLCSKLKKIFCGLYPTFCLYRFFVLGPYKPHRLFVAALYSIFGFSRSDFLLFA